MLTVQWVMLFSERIVIYTSPFVHAISRLLDAAALCSKWRGSVRSVAKKTVFPSGNMTLSLRNMLLTYKNIVCASKNITFTCKNMLLALKNMLFTRKNIVHASKNITFTSGNMLLALKNTAVAPDNMLLTCRNKVFAFRKFLAAAALCSKWQIIHVLGHFCKLQ